jgi:hypothetical protein
LVEQLICNHQVTGSIPVSGTGQQMKEITIKFDEKFYKRLNDARRLEAPDIRNAKFCKELVEAMVGAIEDDHKNKGDKSGNRKKRTNK